MTTHTVTTIMVMLSTRMMRERDHMGYLGVDGSMIFRNWDVGLWTASSWLRIGTGGGHL
jgi:hypothetical protein